VITSTSELLSEWASSSEHARETDIIWLFS